jgi:hypothetical protein
LASPLIVKVMRMIVNVGLALQVGQSFSSQSVSGTRK